MAIWINPDTFDHLEFSVVRPTQNFVEWNTMVEWCSDHIGHSDVDWAFSNAEMQMPRMWFFKKQEDAVAFALAWICG